VLKLFLILLFSCALPVFAGVRPPQHPININSATVTELMQLPRVGAKTAERIVAFRKQHGGFRRVEELMNVKGIGEKSFAKLRQHLSVGPSVVANSTPQAEK
jgi:competence protein ComEA